MTRSTRGRTRDEAAEFIRGVEEDGDHYFTGQERTDVTGKLVARERLLIERMSRAIAAYEARKA